MTQLTDEQQERLLQQLIETPAGERIRMKCGAADLRSVITDGLSQLDSDSQAAAPDDADILDNEAVDKELRRWQDAIRDKLIDLGAPDWKIDGAGCDSGDPLDFTLAEVGQGCGWFIDKAENAATRMRNKCVKTMSAIGDEVLAEFAAELKPDGSSFSVLKREAIIKLLRRLRPALESLTLDEELEPEKRGDD